MYLYELFECLFYWRILTPSSLGPNGWSGNVGLSAPLSRMSLNLGTTIASNSSKFSEKSKRN